MLTARLLRKSLCFLEGYLQLSKRTCSGNTIYLTFDDGPHPIYSNKIMDLLAQYGIKATFFVVGKNVERHMETAKRMVREGHVLGNHTYNHNVNCGAFWKEWHVSIDKCQKKIEALQDSKIRYFRPPQGLIGFIDFGNLMFRNYRTMFWTIDSNDHFHYGDIEPRLWQLQKKQNVILFHDDNALCIDFLIKLIPIWIDQGFQFEIPKA